MEDQKVLGFRSYGRNLARQRRSLQTYLTNNPDLDQHIRHGYEEEVAKQQVIERIEKSDPPPVVTRRAPSKKVERQTSLFD